MILIPMCVALIAGAVYLITSSSSDDSNRLGSGVMFDGIARVYDSANMMMSLGLHHMWKDVLVSKMDIQPGDKVLDLATGTGDIAIKLADAMMTEHPSVKREGQASISPFTMTGSVLGLDPSTKMLEIAKNKVMDKRLTGWITLMHGDAESLDDLPDHTYDKVTISFGIRNFGNRVKALDEARRVLKEDNPGGRVGILEFVSPTEGPLAAAASLFLEYCIPAIGAIMSLGKVNEYKHLRDSIKEFPSPAEFAGMLSTAGFRDCKTENVFAHTVYLWTCSTYVESATRSSTVGEEEASITGAMEQ